MFIIALHPSVTFLASIVAQADLCSDHLDLLTTVALVTGSMVIAGILAVWLWRRLVLIASFRRSVVAFLVVAVGLAVVAASITVVTAVSLTFLTTPPGSLDSTLERYFIVAVLGIAAGIFAVECPPMRRTAWRYWADHPRRQRLGLMLSLGYLGIALLPALALWSLTGLMVAALGCYPGAIR